MSKSLDTLNRRDIGKDVRRQPMHDEIAETYFGASTPAPARKENKNTPKLPWIVAAIAIIAALALLVSRSNIDIRVRVLSEEAPSGVIREGVKGRALYLLKGAGINNGLIKETFFSGDARAYSRLTGSGIVLCNSRGSGWASYTMRFKEPADLTKLDINFIARGAKGGERVGVAIVDAGNRTYRIERDLSPKMGKEDGVYTVDFSPAKRILDLANVSEIRFEFGSLTMENGPMATINLSEVYASKTKRTRWL
jgi:hypothetical protein